MVARYRVSPIVPFDPLPFEVLQCASADSFKQVFLGAVYGIGRMAEACLDKDRRVSRPL